MISALIFTAPALRNLLQIGRELKLSSEELSLLGMGALLHDIGKFNIPESILEKKTPLTPAEWAIIEEHPVHGYRFAKAIGMDDAICRIILHHHLWANGAGGYPASEGVVPCLLTQITTVADVVDAMTHERPYRPPLSIADCMNILKLTPVQNTMLRWFKSLNKY